MRSIVYAAQHTSTATRLIFIPGMLLLLLLSACQNTSQHRPLQLVHGLADSPLKDKLLTCANSTFVPSKFSIAHRGAPLGYPEHTEQGYRAAAAMGAGIIECDVTFTADEELVCRHSQCDLHRTTDILQTPLAQQCSQAFQPASTDMDANAKCCTTDITLAQFRTLCGRRDIVNPKALTIDDYLTAPVPVVNVSPVACGKLLTHSESIELFKSLDVEFTPELKQAEVPMPFNASFSQDNYRDKLIDEYVAAGVPPTQVHVQSFSLEDIKYWISQHPDFARQAVYLDPRGRDPDFSASFEQMQQLKRAGLTTLAPPIPMLLKLDAAGRLTPTDYALFARRAGLELITWTFESGRADDPANWLYGPIAAYMTNEAKMLEVLDALATQVGIKGIFSDWPGTVTYYANCQGI